MANKKPMLKMHEPAKAPKVKAPNSKKPNVMKEYDGVGVGKTKNSMFPMKKKKLSK